MCPSGCLFSIHISVHSAHITACVRVVAIYIYRTNINTKRKWHADPGARTPSTNHPPITHSATRPPHIDCGRRDRRRSSGIYAMVRLYICRASFLAYTFEVDPIIYGLYILYKVNLVYVWLIDSYQQPYLFLDSSYICI